MGIVLRQDQFDLKSAIYGRWNSGVRHVLGVLPTGGGKSVIVSDIVLDTHRMGLKQTVIAHRKELVSQMSLHVARREIAHAILAPPNVISEIRALHREEFGRSFIVSNSDCTVGGIDTLISRKENPEIIRWAAQQSRVTIDEAHHVLRENKWGKGVLMFPNALSLGVTASPARADGMGLGIEYDGIYGAMELGLNMRTLINMGALCDYEIVIPETDFVIDDGDVTEGGDFSPKKMKAASDSSHIVGDTVLNYIKYAYGKRGICFATDVATANKIADNFNLHGIPAAAVSADTPSHVRDEMVKRLKSGKIWMLVNVDLFGEGFDLPAIEVVIMARPTASLAVYLQQFGRALRTLPGKLYGLVIDQVSNFKRHGFPDKPHLWSLARRDRRVKSPPNPEDVGNQVCKHCTKPYSKLLFVCPHCHKEQPLPEGGGRTLKQVDGDLVLLDRAALEEMRKNIQLEAPGDVAVRVGNATRGLGANKAGEQQQERIQTQQALMMDVAWFFGRERAKGRSDRETEKRFYLTLGMSTLEAYALPRADMVKISEIIKQW